MGNNHDEKTFIEIKSKLKSMEEEMNSKYVFMMNNPLDNLQLKRNGDEYYYVKFLIECTGGEKKLFKNAPCALAHTYLGIVYELGAFGAQKNEKMAFEHYLIATKQSNALGTYRLAQCYEKGIYKPKNFRKALAFYRCAAKLGLVEAQHTFGSILIYGDLNSERDVASGIFYLKLAVKKSSSEYPYPYFDLARAYESNNNIHDIVADDIYSFYLYQRGAELGCPNCQYRIARIYEFGELGRDKNITDAVFWYKKSADNGQIDAQLALSTLYFTGVQNVLESNYLTAYKWALKSAVKGHLGAAYCVGEFIENGIGVKRDLVHALWWYTIAGVMGNEKAKIKANQLKKIVVFSSDSTKKKKCLLF
ncbi:Chitin synthase regulatory factor 3 [Dictyocoela muelleri]|nr:Chitin synthase regulatory factor 3 [Dictyocoela muelleri]